MDTLSKCLDMAAVAVESVMCFVFTASFMKEKRLKSYSLLIVLAVLFQTLADYVTIGVKVYSALRFAIFLGMVLFVQFFMYRKDYSKILMITITYFLFLTLIDYSTVAWMTYFSGMEFSYFQKMTNFRMFGTVVSKGVLLFSVVLMEEKFRGLKQLKRKHLLSLFLINISMLFFALYMFQNFMQRNRIYVSEIAMFLLLMLIELLCFYSFSSMVEKKEKEEKIGMLDMYNQMLQKSLDKEKVSFDLWSGKIHDYKNHVLYMMELLDTGDYEKLKQYMQEETGTLEHQSQHIDSGYKGIDAIISSKMYYASQQNIHMFTNIVIPRGLPLEEKAMVTILGNLLDNAIRAELQSGKKLIEIDITYMKENLYIKIINHKEPGNIDFEVSSKEDNMWHGIGLRSVKHEVEKQNGDFKLLQQSDQVIAMVVLYEIVK